MMSCHVMTFLTGAHWAVCAHKHLHGMVYACMSGKVYKPMTTVQKVRPGAPKNYNYDKW